MKGQWIETTADHIESGDILRYFGEVAEVLPNTIHEPYAGMPPVRFKMVNGSEHVIGDGYLDVFRPVNAGRG
jgi:hypothetical protein